MRDKEDFYISTVLAKMFEIPSSTIGQLISRKKYIGGAELEKFRAEMERKGVTIPKKKERKTGGRKVSEKPKPGTPSEAMVH